MDARRLMLPVAAGAVFLAACGDGDQSASTGAPRSAAVSDGDARGVLDDAVSLVRSGDLDQLCEASANNRMCSSTLDEVGRNSAPVGTTPVVIESYDLPARRLPDAEGSAGGRVLEVCGLDGRGDPYFTELLVIMDREAPALMNAVYWSGYRYADGDVSSGPAGDGASGSAEASMTNPEGSASPAPPPAACP